MLKAIAFAMVVGAILIPGIASAKDCMTWCQKIRCTPQNIGAAGSVGACLDRCTSACNAKKK